MRRFSTLAMLLVAAQGFAGGPIMPLTDQEKLELISITKDGLRFSRAMTEAQIAMKNFEQRQNEKLKELQKSHNADGCRLDGAFEWQDCPSLATKPTAKK